ncbi:MAG: methyltransferase domain-containing protein [Bryobacterales bacterium]|nr:methyltransferase domain-containing protein [Bryobacterales bacterium]
MPTPWSSHTYGWHSRSAYRLFLRESLRKIRVTASVLPSSRFLASAMLDQVNFRKVRNVVELGSGTGVITHETLRRMSPDSRLFALEINRNFAQHLRTCYRDPRLTVLNADASDLLNQLAEHDAGKVDVIISSLGLTGMSSEHRTRILRQAEVCLAPAGIMIQFQYLISRTPVPDLPNRTMRRFEEGKFLKNYFRSVSAKPVFLNLPPALVFTCRK